MVTFKNNIKMNSLIITLFVLLMSNCNKDKIWKDDELSTNKEPYTGNQLRIDGYYYELVDGVMHGIYCLYDNGVIHHLGDGIKFSEINQFEQTITTTEFIEKIRKIKYSWGVFKVEGNQIKFERWYPSEPPYKAYVRAGEILNDTTFIITESYRMHKGKKTEVKDRNETYHFKQFSPKPDSTNNFIM